MSSRCFLLPFAGCSDMLRETTFRKDRMESVKVIRCAWCEAPNQIFIDVSAGLEQEYEEDCQVCCRPLTIRVHIDPDTLRIRVDAEMEG